MTVVSFSSCPKSTNGSVTKYPKKSPGKVDPFQYGLRFSVGDRKTKDVKKNFAEPILLIFQESQSCTIFLTDVVNCRQDVRNGTSFSTVIVGVNPLE